MRIAIVAPASRIEPSLADRVQAFAAGSPLSRSMELHFHSQCFLRSGHFAGDDATRGAAFVEAANDPTFDAIWFAAGGYGSCRILDWAMPRLNEAARRKTYLGYSDMGFLLGALYRAGFAHAAHGPMPSDIRRPGGEDAVSRALAYLAGDKAGLEPSLSPTQPSAAFNITILSHLLGTPHQPDLSGHVLMLEETAEAMYRIDRDLFHLTSNPDLRRLAGVRLGRCDSIPPNDPDFGQVEEQIVRHWCGVAGIPFLGAADIGHDAANKIVPFGAAPRVV